VFFYYTWKTGPRKGRNQLFAVRSIELSSEMHWQIFDELRNGRFRAVDLSKLPALRAQIGKSEPMKICGTLADWFETGLEGTVWVCRKTGRTDTTV